MNKPQEWEQGHIDTPAVRREHARLLKRWAVGRATKAEIMRCIELDRRQHWVESRKAERRS